MKLEKFCAIMDAMEDWPRRKFNFDCKKVAHFVTEVTKKKSLILFEGDHKHSRFRWNRYAERVRTDKYMQKWCNKHGTSSKDPWYPFVFTLDEDNDLHMYGTQDSSVAKEFLTKLTSDSISEKMLADITSYFTSIKSDNSAYVVRVDYRKTKDDKYVIKDQHNDKAKAKKIGKDIKAAMEKGYEIGAAIYICTDEDDDDNNYLAVFMMKSV